MTDQAIGFAQAAFVPRGSIIGITRTEGGIVSIKDGIIAGDFVAKFFCLLIVIEVPFTVVFTKSPSRMAGPAVLEDRKRGLVDVGGVLICFSGQLARIGRGEPMSSVHPGRKVPWIFGIEGITDNNFPSSIDTALLKMVTIRNSVIVMAGTTSLLRTVGRLAIRGERVSIEPLQDNLFMQEGLRGNGAWMQKAAA
jgi:hypothetical protein